MKKFILMLLVLALFVPSALADADLSNFVTYDISGGKDDLKMVSHDIFAPYDLTMVNIWATWCGYCVQKMPELAELKTMLPENVNLITICDDAATEPELVLDILEMTGATNIPTLMISEEMLPMLYQYAYTFPTTLFVDSEGRIVGKPISGVPSLKDTAEIYLAAINETLDEMKG